jgi:type II secretory ATPase GspE/PulE/Tfp pilus assembly ATPase PilB-like protein
MVGEDAPGNGGTPRFAFLHGTRIAFKSPSRTVDRWSLPRRARFSHMDTTNKNDSHPAASGPKQPGPPLRIGELLVKEGLLKEADVSRALALQREDQEWGKLPLGEMLVRMGAMSPADLESLLAHPDLRRQLGALAVEKGLVSQGQLEMCLKKERPDQFIGEVLVQEELLSTAGLRTLLREQMDGLRIGELAVQMKLIERGDLEKALRIKKSPRTLGEILCALGLINPLDLNYVLNKYKKQKALEDILLNMGYVTAEQLNLARRERGNGRESLSAVLLQKKMLSLEQLQNALSRQYNIPFRGLPQFVYSDSQKRALSALISAQYAEKHHILPISMEENVLTIATFDPDRVHVLYELRGMYKGVTMSWILITQEKFEELFEILYSKSLSQGSKKEEAPKAHEEDIDFMELDLDEKIDGTEKEGPVYGVHDIEAEEMVNFILKFGILQGASDIHIEQDRSGVRLRYRIDGLLRDPKIGWLHERLQEHVSPVVSRIKIMSNLDIAERRLPQDGVFRINYLDKGQGKRFDLDFRVAICRAIAGENVTIRILDSRKAKVGLDQLGLSPHVVDPFKSLLKSAAGMILVSGPTGSGKSSTLYGALQYVYHPGIKIITAEDPIEYSFPGIMQTQVNPKIQLTFARLLRSFLRLDPDVIFVGEIRDEETAKIGFDAAQTGHLVLSTVHTNDAVSAVSRLLDLKVGHSQIASCLMGVLAQRLVRRVCPSCIQEYVPEEDEWGMFFGEFPTHLKFHKGAGCESCGYSGFKGRTVLSEIFTADKEIAQALIRETGEEDLKRLAGERGMKSMVEDGLSKLHETTLSEMIRMVPQDMIKAFRSGRGASLQRPAGGGNGPGDEASTTNAFTLSSIEEEAVVDRMRENYEALRSRRDRSGGQVDPAAFRAFIAHSFHQIRESYGCKGVTFHLEGEGDDVRLSAIPCGH